MRWTPAFPIDLVPERENDCDALALGDDDKTHISGEQGTVLYERYRESFEGGGE